MLEVDKKLIEAEEKAMLREAEKFYKLREQGKIFKKLISPKFYISEMAEAFKKSKLVQFSALAPMATGVAVGIGGVAAGMAGSGSALVFAGVAVSNGIIAGGVAGVSIAAVKVAGKVGMCLEELEGYSPFKAKSQERRLMFSMKDRQQKIKQMEAVFSDKESSYPAIQGFSHIKVVKSSGQILSQRPQKEKVRE
jgi:hypothetical protein